MPSQFPQYVGWIYPERNYLIFFLLPFFSLSSSLFRSWPAFSGETDMNLRAWSSTYLAPVHISDLELFFSISSLVVIYSFFF